jgi:hypothetical protein
MLMIEKVLYLTFLIAIAASIFISARLSSSEKARQLAPWRRHLLLLALVGNAGSLAGFLVLIFYSVFMPNVSADIKNYWIFFVLAFASAILGAFGNRASRVLVILNGLALAYLWLELAASSV